MAVQGRVDGMQGRHVIGWALPATGRRACVITIADESRAIIAKGRAAFSRPDLAALGVGRNDMAFSIELPGCFQRRIFHVFANGVELPGSPLELGPGRYDGDCMIDQSVLKGWVCERVPALTEPSISIVSQHGVVVGQGQSARDHGAAVPRAAFEIELHNNCFGAGELRLSVLADGIAFTASGCNLALQGNLDLLAPDACAGWLVAPDAPRRRLEIEIFRNEIAVACAGCGDRPRDVRGIYRADARAGFAAAFPVAEDQEIAPARISLRLCGSPVELFGGPFLAAAAPAAIQAAQSAARYALVAPELGPAQKSVIQLALQRFIAAVRTENGFAAPMQPMPAARRQEHRLDIVIPVYRDIAATKQCVDSVLAHRNAAIDRVVLINDASPEPGMAALLEDFLAQPNLFVLTNAENLGFVKAVNRGFAFAGSNDVLLLNSDTVVFAGAFGELHAIAYAAADIGTVTALSNDATIFSYPGHDLASVELADASWAELAETALVENAGRAVEAPTAHGFCMLIKSQALRRTGFFDERFGRGYCEENDFCARAADLGYRHVAAAGVLVQHRGGTSFQVEKDALLARNVAVLGERYREYFPALRDFERRDGMRAARWGLDAWRLKRARQSGAQFVLVICNSLGGGSAKALADIEQASGYGEAVKLSLSCRNDGSMMLSAETPLFHAVFSNSETAELFKLLDPADPSEVMVHQLLGFPEDFIRQLPAWLADRRSSYFAHDYYPLCPRVTFIDAIGDFCDVAPSNTCVRCIAIGGVHDASRLDAIGPAEHRLLFARLLRGFTQVIAPSHASSGFFRRGFPGLEVKVIPHPEATSPPATLMARRAADDEEIVLFGALGPHKGSAKLLEIARRAKMTHPALSFRVIGYTSLDEELLAVGNVRITGRYAPEMLPSLAAEARGNLALFLHEWPETYAYTLSEALRYGFIPMVPDIGAPAERLRALQYGIVYPRPATAGEILQVIEEAGKNYRKKSLF